MNAAQRKYLIEKIQQRTKENIHDLEKKLLEYPSLSNYLYKAIVNGTLKLVDEKSILEALKQKALMAKEGENWLSEERMGFDKTRTVKLRIRDLIVLPEDYLLRVEEVDKHNALIKEKIKTLQNQYIGIEMRIQLASDKTLQKLINEVDDMGELTLLDEKLKFLN